MLVHWLVGCHPELVGLVSHVLLVSSFIVGGCCFFPEACLKLELFTVFGYDWLVLGTWVTLSSLLIFFFEGS